MSRVEKVLADPPAERAVLAGVCRYGTDSYLDIADIVQSTTFTIAANQTIWDCVKHTLDKDNGMTIDIPAIYSAAREIGLEHTLETKQQAQHLQAIFDFPVSQRNVRKFAAKIRKLQVTRLLHTQLGTTQGKLLELNGDESITHILGLAEDSIFDFTSLLNDSEGEPTPIGTGLLAHMIELGKNPVQQMGIPTGFKEFDRAIGGGLRNGTVNVVGARPKTGKTIFTDNVGDHIANEYDTPVLNMDTEMKLSDHQYRTLANRSSVPIDDLETGQYASNPQYESRALKAAEKMEGEGNYYHLSIAGMPLEEQIAAMRRWLMKEVGLEDDGRAKQCVIIYDYLKLMSGEGLSNDLKEYQMLGFMMTALHNFAVRYDIPILALMQLNRDGINKEGTDVASGSDRIVWLCSNFTIFKGKSDEEIGQDGPENGNRKLVPIVSRHGADWPMGDYINCMLEGKFARIKEWKRKSEVEHDKQTLGEGFEVEYDDPGTDIPFS